MSRYLRDFQLASDPAEMRGDFLVALTLNFSNVPDTATLSSEFPDLFSFEIVGSQGFLLISPDAQDFGGVSSLRLGLALNEDTRQAENLAITLPTDYLARVVDSAAPVSLDDVIQGDGRDDYLDAGEGNDTLFGEEGEDFFVGAGGADAHHGGSEIDTVDYRFSSAGVTVDLANNVGTGGYAEGDTWFDIERVFGSIYHNDTLIGGDSDERLFGHGGDDTLIGGAGQDYLDGGAGADSIDGGEGEDTVQYSESDAGVTLDLAAGTGLGGHAEGDTLVNVERVYGSNFADSITGSDADEMLSGAAGDDVLNGGGGDDLLDGGAGADALDGGTGIDTADYGASDAAVVVDLAAGTGAGGYAEGDTLSDIERLHGSRFSDELNGSDTADTIAGRSGDDRISSGDGGDFVFGESGNDDLDGGDGADFIVGGLGSDTVAGGAGNDLLYGDDTSSSGPVTILENGSTNNGVFDQVSHSFETNEGQRFILSFETAFQFVRTRLFSGDFEVYFNGELVQTIRPTSFSFTEQQIELVGTGGLDTVEIREQIGFVDGLTKLIRNVTLFDADTGESIAADDTLLGGAGDDTLYGDQGSDVLDGGTGFDAVSYEASGAAVNVDLLAGTASGGTAEGDTLTSIEKLYGSRHADTLTGNDARNIIKGGGNNDTIEGNGGNDLLFGQGGADVLSGGDGNDFLVGGGGDDVLSGGLGNDRFVGGEGADSHDGGEGIDLVSYSQADDAVFVDLIAGVGSGSAAEGDTFNSIERIFASVHDDTLIGDGSENRFFGNDGNDTLTGNGGADYLAGGDGDDVLNGGDENDALVGGADNDILNGGAGADVLNDGDGDDVLNGGAGNDRLSGSLGADSLNGGTGIDTVSYIGSTAAVTVDLDVGTGLGGYAEGDTLTEIERVFGSRIGGDDLSGSQGDDRLYGLDGDDTLSGRAGDDYLHAGEGADLLDGGIGNDDLRGLAGDDSLFGGEGNDRLHGGAGADALDGGAGSDTADYRLASSGVALNVVTGGTGGEAAGDTYTSIERFHGSAFDDALTGGDELDRLYGNGGNDLIDAQGGNDFIAAGDGDDTVLGGDGDDNIFAEGGNDIVNGGEGRDRIYGQGGDDILTGGATTDTFFFADGDGHDIITDFANNGYEKIDLSAMFGIDSLEDLSIIDTADGAVIDFFDQSITLRGLLASDLDESDFVF